MSAINPAGSALSAENPGRVASAPHKAFERVSADVQVNITNATASAEENRKAQVAERSEQPVKEPDRQREHLEQAVTRLNDYIQSVQRDLHFNIDDESGRMVVKVVDRNTDEVVRQIPDEVALNMARNLRQEEPLSLFTMNV
ncbi:MAG: flagellar biosynthesis protein FlaG [Gammaproteobacteria bacterium]|nr:MAG: flagellar biosynthesis protein FlaG [Gammaproteobacteria bacterium]